MTGLFAFSLDRETFRGAFETRQQALDAAMAALQRRSDMPEGIFVGQWAEPDPQADDHAEAVVERMRDRWRATASEEKFLDAVSEQQLADLDYDIERVLRAWLAKHTLLPRPTKVRAVSEHPIPTVRHVAVSTERETSVMGEA